MKKKYEPCAICEEYIEGVACTMDQCPVAKLKAEVERLTIINRKLSEVNNDLNYQLDVWNPTEAIKKFAERLKKEVDGWYYDFANFDDTMDALNDIDNLVKEMTEEQE